MLIELQPPFNSLWRKGYLRADSSSGRKYLSLYNQKGDQRSISYARYLLSVHLGYIIPDHLEVDHIDDDCTNDNITNLQLLTFEQNVQKQAARAMYIDKYFYIFCCANCDNLFSIDEREYKKRMHCNPDGYAFCSHPCSQRFHTDQRLIARGKVLPDSLERQLQKHRDFILASGI